MEVVLLEEELESCCIVVDDLVDECVFSHTPNGDARVLGKEEKLSEWNVEDGNELTSNHVTVCLELFGCSRMSVL